MVSTLKRLLLKSASDIKSMAQHWLISVTSTLGSLALLICFALFLYRKLRPSWRYILYTALWFTFHPSRSKSTCILLYPYRTLAWAMSIIRILKGILSAFLAIYRWVDLQNLIALQHQRSLIL